jgi:hypothetical protein
MHFIAQHIKWIMLVAGALTCTMIYAAIAPEAAFLSNFGEALAGGPAAVLVVRNWGVLITLVGAMLVYGAFHPPVRHLVATVAVASKLCFIALVLLSAEGRFLQHGAGMAIAVDLVVVVLLVLFLASRDTQGSS